jgi:Cysteine-rich CPCC
LSICFWQDDLVQLAFPDLAGGANKCSLIEGQQNYKRFGACEERVKTFVRSSNESEAKDKEWRPLDMDRDRYLHWGSEEDHQQWQPIKDSETLCLYYWLPDYWLGKNPR